MTSRTLTAVRNMPAALTLAAALITLYPVPDLGAQTPPTPPVTPARPAPRPAPVAPTPRVAPAPRPAIAPDVWLDGRMYIDRAEIAEIAEHASLAAATAMASIDMEAIRASAVDAARAATSLRGLGELAALAPMAPMDMSGLETMARDAAFAARWAPARAYEYGFESGFAPVSTRSLRSQPPEPTTSDDPADSLYREARKALSSDSYRKAAELFRRIRDQHPKSSYTPDAPYWEAFALARIGGESELRAAKDALEWQQRQYPKASTRGDASSLGTRIDGQLARRGDSQAYSNLVGTVNQATSQGCPKDSEDERVAALNALARMDTAQVIPVLKKVLARREACTQALRKTAVWLYASRRVSDAPQVLMNVARTDPDKEVREQAVFWMANVPTDEAANMLVDLAKSGNDLDLRKRAVYALSRSKSTRAAATLREIATDAGAPSELRRDALQWYMNGPGKTDANAMSFLRDVYGRADEQNFRNGVLSVIASRKNDEAKQFLTDIVGNTRESIETRRHALSALYSAGTTAAQLTSIYDRSPEYEIKRSVIGVLGSARNNVGVDKLLDIARNEKEPRLKSYAVSMLSRTKDPRAMALLQEIILK